MHYLAEHIEAGWQTFHLGLSRIKDYEPDSVQIELYEFAFSYAELLASQQLVEYSVRVSESTLVDLLTECYLGTTLQNLQDRLRLVNVLDKNQGDLELPGKIQAFVSVATAPKKWVLLGEMLRAADGDLPPSVLGEELETMRESIRRFSDEVVAPLAEEIHRNDQMIPVEILDGVRELGCFALSVPDRYGGLKPDEGENTSGMVVVTEELSRGSLGAAGSLITRPEIMVRALLEGGTELQRERWLPVIASGRKLCAVSVTEPDTGSDVASVSLKATQSDSGWTLNGEKNWCTFAGKAELILLLARTNPTANPPHRGLSLFVIEKPAFDGHEFEVQSQNGGRLTGKAIPTLGYRGMHSFSMFFDNFFVPNDCLVGEESGTNRGFYYTMRGFSGGRLQTAARATGLMHAAYQSAFAYSRQRSVFGQLVGDYQLSLAKLAKMVTYIVAIKQFAYHVANLMDQGEGQLEASSVKLIACKYAEWVTREALQLLGGMGYAEESAVSRYFVDARVLSIFEGAEETLALKVVGRSLLQQASATQTGAGNGI
ncbi:MAG: acyl-CoA/acyl-ACP dehydrogenase [Gammaproteobacteria bacterium]|nr:acyl-CoA/acyl-ACP dehydrogenase [Gammaproteobacteria bacterium]